MTVGDIIKTGLAFVYETENTDKEAYKHSKPILQALVADCLNAENYYRVTHRQTMLDSFPALTAMTTTVPYNDALTGVALPYGIAWKYCEQNGKQSEAQSYRELYERTRDANGGKYYEVRK